MTTTLLSVDRAEEEPERLGRMQENQRYNLRVLAEAGVAYQDLVFEARQDLAKRLLRASDYGLGEVAFLTGFADQSTFSRAFKRWCGETPRAYRLGAPH